MLFVFIFNNPPSPLRSARETGEFGTLFQNSQTPFQFGSSLLQTPNVLRAGQGILIEGGRALSFLPFAGLATKGVGRASALARETALIRHPFAEGGSHLTTTKFLDDFKKLGSTTYGDPSKGLFIVPKSQMDDLLRSTSSRSQLEVMLGLKSDHLAKGQLVRIDIDQPFKFNLRLPDAASGNIYHRSGTGQTTGGLYEALVDAIQKGRRGVRRRTLYGY